MDPTEKDFDTAFTNLEGSAASFGHRVERGRLRYVGTRTPNFYVLNGLRFETECLGCGMVLAETLSGGCHFAFSCEDDHVCLAVSGLNDEKETKMNAHEKIAELQVALVGDAEHWAVAVVRNDYSMAAELMYRVKRVALAINMARIKLGAAGGARIPLRTFETETELIVTSAHVDYPPDGPIQVEKVDVKFDRVLPPLVRPNMERPRSLPFEVGHPDSWTAEELIRKLQALPPGTRVFGELEVELDTSTRLAKAPENSSTEAE